MKKFYLLILALFFTVVQYGQNLAAIDRVNGPAPTAVGTAANVSATGLTRTGVNQVGANTLTEFSSITWETTAIRNTAKYLQWSVKGNTGFSLILTELNIQYQRVNNQAPKTIDIYYSTNGFATSTLLRSDTYANNDNLVKTLAIDMTGIAVGSGATITFRLYGYDSANTNGQLNITGNTAWAVGTVTNPGIRLRGSVTNADLVFNTNAWTPFAPNTSTGNNNARVENGTYTPAANIALNTLTVRPTGNVSVPVGITVTSPTNQFESTSTQYSSLILNGTITGTVNYSRHVNSGAVGGVGGNDLIAPPLSGQTFGAFASANNNIRTDPNNANRKLFGPFNKSTGAFQIYDTSVDGGTALAAGTGYRAASTNNGTFTFTGTVNTGTVNKSIVNSGSNFAPWNLVGNPYPSYLYVKELTGPGAHPGFLNTNAAQLNPNYVAIYGYDNNASDGDIYTIWNLANTTPSTVMTPGQGFFVASNVGGGSVDFTAGMRSIGTTDDFIVGRQANEDNNATMRLELANGSQNFVTDFYFNDNSTLGLDPGYDAGLFGGSTPAFSIFSQLVENNSGVNMAIQSLLYSSLGSEVIVPIGLRVTQGQQVTISMLNSTIPDGVEVYLEDSVANTTTLLSGADYVFTTTSNLNGIGRFFLRFTSSTLSTPELTSNVLQIYTIAAQRTLFIKGQLAAATTVSLYDIQGRMVLSSVLDTASNSNQVDVSNLSSGVYVVKVSNSSQQKTQKVILN
jgi:hypothetical protein